MLMRERVALSMDSELRWLSTQHERRQQKSRWTYDKFLSLDELKPERKMGRKTRSEPEVEPRRFRCAAGSAIANFKMWL